MKAATIPFISTHLLIWYRRFPGTRRSRISLFARFVAIYIFRTPDPNGCAARYDQSSDSCFANEWIHPYVLFFDVARRSMTKSLRKRGKPIKNPGRERLKLRRQDIMNIKSTLLYFDRGKPFYPLVMEYAIQLMGLKDFHLRGGYCSLNYIGSHYFCPTFGGSAKTWAKRTA